MKTYEVEYIAEDGQKEFTFVKATSYEDALRKANKLDFIKKLVWINRYGQEV